MPGPTRAPHRSPAGSTSHLPRSPDRASRLRLGSGERGTLLPGQSRRVRSSANTAGAHDTRAPATSQPRERSRTARRSIAEFSHEHVGDQCARSRSRRRGRSVPRESIDPSPGPATRRPPPSPSRTRVAETPHEPPDPDGIAIDARSDGGVVATVEAGELFTKRRRVIEASARGIAAGGSPRTGPSNTASTTSSRLDAARRVGSGRTVSSTCIEHSPKAGIPASGIVLRSRCGLASRDVDLR